MILTKQVENLSLPIFSICHLLMLGKILFLISFSSLPHPSLTPMPESKPKLYTGENVLKTAVKDPPLQLSLPNDEPSLETRPINISKDVIY